MPQQKIVIGTTSFNDVVADASLKFVVAGKEGKLYKCVCEDEDYGPVTRYYTREDVLSRASWDSIFDDLAKQRDNFWDSQEVGTVLHYHNGFGQFVRGEVVEIDGEKRLMPKALVGAWSKSDLPSRTSTGEIHYPYHAKKIIEQNDEGAWQPSDGCVYESPSFSPPARNAADPRTLPEIDLTLPEMTTQEQVEAAKEIRLKAIADVISSRYKTRMSADDTLAEVERLLTA